MVQLCGPWLIIPSGHEATSSGPTDDIHFEVPMQTRPTRRPSCTAAIGPSVSFLIRKQPLGVTSSNDRLWPTLAVRLARAPKAGIEPNSPFELVVANVS